jgi:prevent-host-death family protein
MSKQYSIAEARHDLAAIVHEAEENGPIEFTRRGKTVAVLLALDDYQRLMQNDFDFRAAYQQFRASADFEALNIGPEVFDVREHSSGREEVAF